MPNHHYVPQFYLRRFGTDTHVSAILMNHGFQFVESAKIKGQSSKPDYYRFPEVESIFGQIEGEASRLMRNISGYVPLVEDDAIFLKQYVAFQMMRTPAFVQTIGNLMDEGMSSVFSARGEYQLYKEALDSNGFPDAELSAWRHLGAACDEVQDLKIRYLLSRRDGFLTSDQPVAVYNPWALKGGFARNGLGCRGVMLFLPIGARICIMLYDGEVYSVRSQDRKSAFISIGRRDEERLNKLQMVGNRSVIYLPRPDRYLEVEALSRSVRDAYPPATTAPAVKWVKSDDGSSSVLGVYEPPIDLGDWTFLYESNDWRKVPLGARGFGVYGSRDSTRDSGLRMLSSTHPWNSTRYTDDEGRVSYLRNPL